jgi:hypothetical protein
VLTVNPASLMVTASNHSRSYGMANPPLSGSMVGLQPGDDITASFTTTATTNSPQGAYSISFTLTDPGGKLGNYVVTTNNGTLSVTSAVLTATADNQSRAYGQANPALSIRYEGLVNGEDTNVIDVLPVAATPATNTSAPGTYTIAPSGGADDNYLFVHVDGTLVITPPGPVTITSVLLLDIARLQINGVGDVNVTYTVQESSDLAVWEALGTTTTDGAGAFEYVDGTAGAASHRFYRVALP